MSERQVEKAGIRHAQAMAKRIVTYHFSQAVINTQGIATDDNGDYLLSSVDFEVEYDGRRSGPLSAMVKQSAGSSYFGDVLEVGMPPMYEGPFDHASFRVFAEQYIRFFLGRPGSGAAIVVADVKDVTFKNLTMTRPWTVSIPLG
jgi:hypothetical protein